MYEQEEMKANSMEAAPSAEEVAAFIQLYPFLTDLSICAEHSSQRNGRWILNREIDALKSIKKPVDS